MRSGTVDGLGTAALCRRLSAESRTGCLRLDGRDGQARIWFREGQVVTASVPGDTARLGERLVEAGELSPEALQAVLDRQDALLLPHRLGELLVADRLVGRDVVRRAVRELLADAIATVLAWPEATWELEDGPELRVDVPLGLSTAEMLMEAGRRMRSPQLLRGRLGSHDAVVDIDPAGQGTRLALKADEWDVLAHIDGRATIAGIAAATGQPVLEVARTVHGLLLAGVVTVVGA